MSASTEVRKYTPDTATVSSVLRILAPNLPYSLPLYRRLQYGNFTHSSSLITNLQLSSSSESTPEPWIIAYIDRTRRPETEIFLHASWENALTTASSLATSSQIKDLLTSLFTSIAAIPVPTAEEPRTPTDPAKTNIYTAHLASPSIVLLGAVHALTANLIRDLGFLSLSTEIEADGLPEAYNKWIFRLHERMPTARSLPEGLRFGKLGDGDFGLVRARTSIPRQDATLRVLPSVGVFEVEGEKAVGWAFLGVDGSLSTLHVEEEFRGLGVAKAIAVRLWEEGLGSFNGGKEGKCEGEMWAHADVATYNGQSNGVCKGLGGETLYVDYWLRVDLNRVTAR